MSEYNPKPGDLKLGQRVRVIGESKEGTIERFNSEGRAVVDWGLYVTPERQENLEIVDSI